LSPRTSLRRTPVMAASHSNENRRCPPAARRNCCGCSAVQDCASGFWIAPSRGERAIRATLVVSSPSAYGVVERAAEDEVYLVHRLGGKGGPLRVRGEEPVVERLDVMLAELP